MFKGWIETNEGREVARAALLKGAENARKRAEELENQASAMGPLECPPTALALAAYLSHCADLGLVPSYAHSLTVSGDKGRPYRIHAAALPSALRDAIALGWVGVQPDGALYTRDGAAPMHALEEAWKKSA